LIPYFFGISLFQPAPAISGAKPLMYSRLR
jgi:hypothetical protein